MCIQYFIAHFKWSSFYPLNVYKCVQAFYGVLNIWRCTTIWGIKGYSNFESSYLLKELSSV